MSRMFREDINGDHAAARPEKITKHGGAVKSVALVEGLREVMQRQTTVSFSDCSSSAGGLEGDKRERYSNSDRMGSRKRILSGIYRRDSDDSGGEDCRRKFSNSPVGAAGVRQYCKDMVPQSNGWWGAQTYEKCQREWPSTFNGKDETAPKTLTAFNLGRPADAITEMKPQLQVGHPQTRLLGVHSKGQIVSKHDYEEETGHSKKIDRFRCSEADQEKEEREFKGSGGGEDDKKASLWRREHMFEKAVTPSDVGKLNRLVIPKQHAKKYFPLDTDANEKGLLLNFEDSAGKAWRFRYSYWNSSQSYVFTKGWSRFVKEKKLDDGDIVSFDRATHQDPNLQRLFISCKRKPCNAAKPPGLPGSIKRPLQFRSPFQFPYDAIYNIGGSHGQHLVTSRALIGPQRSPLFSPTNNNVGGESSRGAAETRNMETNSKPMDLLTNLHFITSDDKTRKGIHEYSAFPFSTRRSSDTIECGRVDTESSGRKTSPLRTMHFKAPGSSPDDLSAATSFDHSTSKKVVRLFGVNLECGKFNDNYEDELPLIRQAEPLFSQITEGAKQLVKRNCRYTEFHPG